MQRIDVICDSFCMNRSTFIKMAIYHGIEKINKGYIPYRNHAIKKYSKKKYEIVLPEETWVEFENMMKKIEYKVEEHIPDGEMIELFIRIEMKRARYLYNLFMKDDDIDDSFLFDEKYPITITATIPNIFMEKICDIEKVTGLQEININRYLVINALLQECCQEHFVTIDSDADLLKHIEMVGLDKYKTLILLRNLIQANKIMLITDKDIEYK